MLQIKAFEYKTWSEIEEKFNWWMDNHKPRQVINVSFHATEGRDPCLTVLYDNEPPQKQEIGLPHMVLPRPMGRG